MKKKAELYFRGSKLFLRYNKEFYILYEVTTHPARIARIGEAAALKEDLEEQTKFLEQGSFTHELWISTDTIEETVYDLKEAARILEGLASLGLIISVDHVQDGGSHFTEVGVRIPKDLELCRDPSK
jgi:hypothetical protein